jgi:PIN domain nuclease of toxin-antitoxin system
VTVVRLLLDTHTFLWWLDGDRRISRRARTAIADEDNEILVSAATAWELSTKARLGKLPGAVAVATDVAGALAQQGFQELPITVLHAQRAGGLRVEHRDPFDRMLIAQTQMEDLVIISNEALFDAFGVARLW